MFPPVLLKQDEAAVLAGYRGERILAGAMANLAAGCVGVTNNFAIKAETVSATAGCIELAMKLFPDLPLAGYESGARLVLMTHLGFKPIGSLAVWLKPGKTI